QIARDPAGFFNQRPVDVADGGSELFVVCSAAHRKRDHAVHVPSLEQDWVQRSEFGLECLTGHAGLVISDDHEGFERVGSEVLTPLWEGRDELFQGVAAVDVLWDVDVTGQVGVFRTAAGTEWGADTNGKDISLTISESLTRLTR